ncbi:MAG: hypothetical protein CMH54_02040 [Myxococcales bacterium]|nr:hypothetical protein [Myxococcales bacterium]
MGLRFSALAICLLMGFGCSSATDTTPNDEPSSDSGIDPGVSNAQGPDSYFIAVHCDPNVTFPEEFLHLDTMVLAANEQNVKLTLMFTPQWVEYILGAPSRKDRFDFWVASGHEIAMHHHSVYHPGTWDQYSDFEYDEYAPIMGFAKADNAEKLGDLDDLMASLDTLHPGIKAGCANDEADKSVMPDAVVKDTCSGFSNSYAYPVGTRAEGADPLKSVNDFALVGTTANGIERRWLSHGMISAPFIDATELAFNEMNGGAHGVVIHTNDHDVSSLNSWLIILANYDQGAGSDTVSGILDGGTLPEETIDPAILNAIYEESGKDKENGPPGP